MKVGDQNKATGRENERGGEARKRGEPGRSGKENRKTKGRTGLGAVSEFLK